MDGVLVVDKPVGPTSHDIVARARRALGERRIGHTGTLDPGASGLLALVLGKATRLARFLSASDKSYDAVIRLGFSTDTADAQGTATGPVYSGVLPTRDEVEHALDAFRGAFLQQPPAYSAKKVGGRRSYTLARAASRAGGSGARNVPPDAGDPTPSPLEPAAVTVTALTLLGVEGDLVSVRVDCSAGFYVRSLAHDVGARLGIGGHLAALRRTRSGDYALAQAVSADALERDPASALAGLVPLSQMLPRLASVVLTAQGTKHALHGRTLEPADLASALGPGRATTSGAGDEAAWVRLITEQGELLGLAQPTTGPGLLHPSVVLM